MSRGQQATWEAIAASFDRSRRRSWPHVEAFLQTLPRGARVLDLMGGNGRHLPAVAAAGHAALWVDFSRPAARITAARHPEAAVVVADAGKLPVADGAVDACIFVAGLHAVPDAAHRAQVLAELARVLRPGGAAQVTVWSRDAPRFAAQGVPGEPLDVVLPWRSDGHDEARPTHLYTAAALRRDLEAAGLTVASVESVGVVGPADNLVALVSA